jgi:hypothetical protein
MKSCNNCKPTLISFIKLPAQKTSKKVDEIMHIEDAHGGGWRPFLLYQKARDIGHALSLVKIIISDIKDAKNLFQNHKKMLPWRFTPRSRWKLSWQGYPTGVSGRCTGLWRVVKVHVIFNHMVEVRFQGDGLSVGKFHCCNRWVCLWRSLEGIDIIWSSIKLWPKRPQKQWSIATCNHQPKGTVLHCYVMSTTNN